MVAKTKEPEVTQTELTPAQRLALATTFAGINLIEIPAKANAIYESHHVNNATPYVKIGNAAGPALAGKVDVKFRYVRERMEQLFGTFGVGWKLYPDPIIGVSTVTQDGKNHLVDWRNWRFAFLMIYPDGAMEWNDSVLISEGHVSSDLGYAYRGVFTSAMKQVLRMFGAADHIYDGFVDGQGDDDPDESPVAPRQLPQQNKPQHTKPAASKPQSSDGNKATSKTGLDKINNTTPIDSANWDWMKPETKAQFLAKYAGKTFGDLDENARKRVAGIKPLPFEVQEYLDSTF